MNPREFFEAVALMRDNQKKYFESRSQLHLRESKRLEKLIDTEIERVRKITDPPQEETPDQQQTLFR